MAYRYPTSATGKSLMTAATIDYAGPPTTGTWTVGSVVQDAYGALFRCSVAGTPGTWKNITPGFMPQPATEQRGYSSWVSNGGSSITLSSTPTSLPLNDVTWFPNPGGNQWEIVIGTGVYELNPANRVLAYYTGVSGTTLTGVVTRDGSTQVVSDGLNVWFGKPGLMSGYMRVPNGITARSAEDNRAHDLVLCASYDDERDWTRAISDLTGGPYTLSSTPTSITVSDASQFPIPSSGSNPIYIDTTTYDVLHSTIGSGTNRIVAQYTGKTGNTLTGVTTQDGSTKVATSGGGVKVWLAVPGHPTRADYDIILTREAGSFGRLMIGLPVRFPSSGQIFTDGNGSTIMSFSGGTGLPTNLDSDPLPIGGIGIHGLLVGKSGGGDLVLRSGKTANKIALQNASGTTKFGVDNTGAYLPNAVDLRFVATDGNAYGSIATDSSNRLNLRSPGGGFRFLNNAFNAVLAQITDVGIATITGSSSTASASIGTITANLSGASGTQYGATIAPTLTQSSTAGYTALRVNATETTTGSGTKLLADFQVGGTSKLAVDNTGRTLHASGGTIELYNTADQTTNYEKLITRFSSNVAEFGTLYGGTGSARSLRLGAGATAGNGVLSRYMQINFGIPFWQFLTNTSATGSMFQISSIATLSYSASSGNQTMLAIDPTMNQSSTAGYTMLLVNPTDNGTSTGTKLLADFQVGGTSKAKIDNTGVITGLNHVSTKTSTATAAGTTTLSNASSQTQEFTGTTTQTVKLPTTYIVAGQSYTIVNNSTGAVTVQSSGGNTVSTVSAGTLQLFVAQKDTPTAAADWRAI